MKVLKSCTPVACRFVAVCLWFAVASTGFAQYTVVLLQPAGFSASGLGGISGPTQCGAASGPLTGNEGHAFLWTGTPESGVDLNPSGMTLSYIAGISGGTQVGTGRGPSTGSRDHALLWLGTPASAVDLTPTWTIGGYGLLFSGAYGVSGDSQVGYVQTGAPYYTSHAVLWKGNAASAVDLTPNGADAAATAVSGNVQVGFEGAPGPASHAMLWQGTAASAVDLNPPNFANSSVYGVYGNIQVGWGSLVGGNNPFHALLWMGTAGSAVDLNPSGFDSSQGVAASSSAQVGWGFVTPSSAAISHALLWHGTSASALDLHQFLTGLTYGGQPLPLVQSQATAIDDNGNIVGVGQDAAHTQYAVMWVPGRVVTGTVNLQSLSASAVAGTVVTFELRSPGSTTALDVRTAALDAGGNFKFTTSLPAGTYDITAKGSHWLRQNLHSEVMSSGGVSGLSYSLINGDVNGDNVVSLADFGALRAAFGSSSGGSNWNPNADLNGDGTVSLADFGILRSNFGRQGDP